MRMIAVAAVIAALALGCERSRPFNVNRLEGALAQVKCDCRYLLFDQVVMTKCRKA